MSNQKCIILKVWTTAIIIISIKKTFRFYAMSKCDTNFYFFSNNEKYKILSLFDLQNLAAAYKNRRLHLRRSSYSCNREDVTNVSQNIVMLCHSS